LITTGIADATRVEIVDGLSADEVVVTGPFRSLDQLKDGSKVKTETPKGDSKDAAPTPSEQPPAVAKGNG
jgi:HlyD family secretion protein